MSNKQREAITAILDGENVFITGSGMLTFHIQGGRLLLSIIQRRLL